MGTQKVHCRGGGAARPALRQSFSSRVDEEHRPLHTEADACIRGNKRKAPCRTYRQGAFSGARYRTRTCDLLHVKHEVKLRRILFPPLVIVLYIDFVIFFNVQFAHKCISIIPQYHDMSINIASQYPKKENHGRSRIIFPNQRKKLAGRLKKGTLVPVW